MLQLGLAAALEVLNASVGREPGRQLSWQLQNLDTFTRSFLVIILSAHQGLAKRPCGIPETDRILNAELVGKPFGSEACGAQCFGAVEFKPHPPPLKKKTYMYIYAYMYIYKQK